MQQQRYGKIVDENVDVEKSQTMDNKKKMQQQRY
jgi:hypothetical protein